MSGGHHRRALPRTTATSAAARLSPETKVVAALVFVATAVVTRREAVWAFIVLAGLVVFAAMAVYLPLRVLSRSLLFELPFVAFALLMPFVGRGRRVAVGPVHLSVAGLWSGWSVLAKGSLGVTATAVLVATTTTPDIVRGVERLHAPKILTAIASFMLRYLEVLRGEAARMRIARISRGDDPRFVWQARALAGTSAALFVRAFERGERVHLAMAARGFTGTLPRAATGTASGRDWMVALAVPAAAVCVSVGSWVLR